MVAKFTNEYRPLLIALGLGLLASCSSGLSTPIRGSIEAMTAPWGPFSRQCATTRVSYFVSRPRLSPEEVTESHKKCIGFSALPADNGSMAITASIGTGDRASSPSIVRFLRRPGGQAREAVPGDTGLLAQGSDDTDAAKNLARQIGLSEPQTIRSDQTLVLSVRLSMPSPLDVQLSCRPNGGGRMDQRDTLILACTGNQDVRLDNVVGRLQLAGVEEIDVQSGVRLASRLSGLLDGEKLSDNNHWQFDHYRLFYTLDTEFQ